jgi:3-oxoacyl-[acyl-carrier-protein] synthase-3
VIAGISSYLPGGRPENSRLATELGRWTAEEIFAKTGIQSRCIAEPGETAVDLAVKAVEGLRKSVSLDELDFLLLCTQSGEYKLPSSSCLVQARCGLPNSCGCLDINLACSGFIYGLSVAEALVSSQARSVMLVTSDTYTRYLHPKDTVCRPLFGDGAAATLVSRGPGARVSGFAFGTDGSRAMSMSLPAGGTKLPEYRVGAELSPQDPEFIQMNGPEIYNFTLGAVPAIIATTLGKAGIADSQIDYYVFHQANGFMLEALRRKLRIAPERFVIDLADTGNLVSASIPVVLEKMRRCGQLTPGVRTLLCGFGVGLSWGACIVEW